MTTTTPTPATRSDMSRGTMAVDVPSVDWRAVVAGAFGAIAISFVLIGFGSALGLSLTSARPYAGLSVTWLAILAALWLSIVHVIAFAAGGYLAGRMRVPISGQSDEREFRDGAHGFLVWALVTVVFAIVLASGTTALTGKAVDSAGKMVSAGTQAATANPAAAEQAVLYGVDRMMRSSSSATQAPSQTQSADVPRQSAEIARIFTVAFAQGTLPTADRDYVAGLVTARTGLAEAEARRRVDEAFTQLQTTARNAEAKVRDAAEAARKAAIASAFLAAAVALVGLLAAAWAATGGGNDRDSGRALVVFGRPRFW